MYYYGDVHLVTVVADAAYGTGGVNVKVCDDVDALKHAQTVGRIWLR